MTEYSKFNVIYRLQKWLDSVPGQTFMNYAYSWGAAVVILGTLFKLTHLPGANIALFLGMGTEVFVFFISAFDRPFDKTADGKELPTHVTEEDMEAAYENDMAEHAAGEQGTAQQPAVAGMQGGGTIIIGGAMPAAGGNAAAAAAGNETGTEGTETDAAAAATIAGNAAAAGMAAAAVAVPQWVAEQQQVSPEMAEATNRYVEELDKLTEVLARVAEQSERLTRDSEEMENLNRTLTGICKVYEMQLKGASAQIGTIDQINEQSRRMAAQIEQLNAIYTRMIEAMTVNMRVAAPGATPQV